MHVRLARRAASGAINVALVCAEAPIVIYTAAFLFCS